MNEDERWMLQALALARMAAEEGEIPVGAVAVKGSSIVGRGYNRTEALQDPTAHAEMLAITAATETLGYQRLEGVTLYVTLEPCCMCAGALVLARIDRLVFGAWDPKAGACGTLYQIPQDGRLNHQMEVLGGVLEPDCAEALRHFFQQLRQKDPAADTD